MIHRGWICLLLGALAWGQAAAPASSATPQKPAAPSGVVATGTQAVPPPEPVKLPPDAPVITIPGVCDNPPADKSKAADCKTVITRAEFDQLGDVFAPNLPPSARRQLATQYATALVMAQEAHRRGLDQGPRFEELMKAQRVGVLSRELYTKLQEEAAQVPDKDVEDYYRKNDVMYQEADLQRIFIPHSKQLDPPKDKLSEEETKKRQQEAEEAMKKEAESVRARAVAGGDFDKLQEEAYTAAGSKMKAVGAKMGRVRRTSLPADQASVFDLKAGEVSQVFANPSGYAVYKVGEKGIVPLEKVRQEIVNTLRSQRLQDSVQAIQQSGTAVLNPDYFGEATPAPPTLTPRVQPQPGTKPAIQPPAPAPK